MRMMKLFFLLILCSISFIPFLVFGQVVINEVMANPAGGNNDEFIELYNNSSEAVDLNGWKFSDGDAEDDIIAWVEGTHGEITDPDPSFGTTILPARSYAVILDPDYETGLQPYNFPTGCIILTIGNSVMGGYGLANDDPITLYDASYSVVSTYGTPNDPNDGVPLDPGSDYSVERLHPSIPDAEGNWAKSIQTKGTPGVQNSVYDSSLPVFLTSFSASVIQNGILLRWSTASEVNNAGFYVCRSDNSDGGFDRITNLIPGAGNSDNAQTYQFVDRNVANGETYYYQIEDVDINGITAKHQTISVTFRTDERAGETPNVFNISPGYPSPFGDKPGYSATFIKLNITKEMAKNPFTISIFNLLGQRVYQFAPAAIHAGSHVLQWHGLDNHGNRLSAGPYFWVIRSKGIHEVRRVMLLR